MSRITAIETAIPSGIMPNLLLVRIHTEDGFIGCGETYYTPHAIAALIHIGWQSACSEPMRWPLKRTGASSMSAARRFPIRARRDTRALLAIDLALWDILGQACNQPAYRLLSGNGARCNSGVQYERRSELRRAGGCPAQVPRHPGWPGYGDIGSKGPLQQNPGPPICCR